MIEIVKENNDKPICQECRNEILDPNSRRYFYPFSGCNNCGSFFSIFSKKELYFDICDECKKEYDDVKSRRFKYSFICCSKCGPKIYLNNQYFEDYYLLFKEISMILSKGEIIALKTSNIYYLICDATNESAIEKLRSIKRTQKPLPIAFSSLEMLKEYITTEEKIDDNSLDIKIIRALNSKFSSKISSNDYFGIWIANDPFFVLIFNFFNKPLVFSSLNISSESPYIDDEEVLEKFYDKVKYIVYNNLKINNIQDFSIVYNELGLCIRIGIGRVGKFIKTDYEFFDSICLGPELESSICLVKENKIFLSTRLGHLVSQHVFDNYQKMVHKLIDLYDLNPKMVVCDLHPYYLSTTFAEDLSYNIGVELRKVQHHKAHIYSLIIDRNIKGKLIGFSFDGTGYGEDGKIWGGEVFVGDIFNLYRVAHFRYIPIVAGDSAIENPVFIALSFVAKFLPQKLNLFNEINNFQKQIVIKQIEKDENVYYTSSVGRLFDIAAVLLKIRENQKITFSGQAAIELENLALKSSENSYLPFSINKENDMLIVDFLETFKYILEKRDYENYNDLARKFHNTITQAMYEIAKNIMDNYGIDTVGFSGGVFQNKILCYSILEKFRVFKIYFHKNIPPNDSGIALGQLNASIK